MKSMESSRYKSDLPTTLIAFIEKVLIDRYWFGLISNALFYLMACFIIKATIRNFLVLHCAFPQPTGKVRCYGHHVASREIAQ